MKARMLIAGVLLALAACSSIQTQKQKVEVTCAGATTAIEALTVANKAHKLSTAQQVEVQKAISITDPICKAETPPTNDELKMQAFFAAATVLQNVLAGVK